MKTLDIKIKKETKWSIGIYKGRSPFAFSHEGVQNPVLTARNVEDISADFVADPFMVYEKNIWYMFFEVMNIETKNGVIGLATSTDGLKWKYEKIVLEEPFHLSYPYVFKWQEEYYMIPETTAVNSVRLYKSIRFPMEWSFVKTLLDNDVYHDPSIFYYADKWWLFAAVRTNGNLCLYYADALTGPWHEHPKNPIVSENPHIARPGGRVLVLNDQLIRYAQDDKPTYGNQVHAFQIIKLATTDYEEKTINENPMLKPSGSGWNKIGMHTIDPHKINEDLWIACVDGRGNNDLETNSNN